MDLRLKERLVGAIVLVLLGVWLIPWLLDGENDESEPADAVALSLPTPEDAAPVKTRTIDLDEERRPPAAAARAESGASRPGGAGPHEAAGAALPQPAPVQSSSALKAASPSRTEPAAAEAAPSAPGTAASAAAGEWAVQLGSFGDEANADRLAARVSTYGYDAAVSPYRAGGRVMHRVRVGPQPTRAEAEAVASSLSAHGFVAQVVTAD